MKGLITTYVLARLRETSTWRALFMLLAAYGLYIGTPDQQAALAALGVALAGGVGAFLPDRLRPPVVQPKPRTPSKLDDLATQFGDK